VTGLTYLRTERQTVCSTSTEKQLQTDRLLYDGQTDEGRRVWDVLRFESNMHLFFILVFEIVGHRALSTGAAASMTEDEVLIHETSL
jgi:hypothetical protein